MAPEYLQKQQMALDPPTFLTPASDPKKQDPGLPAQQQNLLGPDLGLAQTFP